MINNPQTQNALHQCVLDSHFLNFKWLAARFEFLRGPLSSYAAFLLGLLACNNVNAGNVYIAVDNYEYDFRLADVDLELNPVGLAIGGEFEINSNLFVQYEFGRWDDAANIGGPKNAFSDFESTLLNVGIGADVWGWDIVASYTEIKDETSFQYRPQIRAIRFGDVDLQSFKLELTRAVEKGRWETYFSFGLQYDEAKSVEVLVDANQMLIQRSDSLFGMARYGGDYYLPTKNHSGWFLGTSFSWYQELSSGDALMAFNLGNDGVLMPMPPLFGNGPRNGGGNGNGGANINRTFGNSFGLVAVYATYQINERWSVDWSTSIGFSGDENLNSHALTLGFMF